MKQLAFMILALIIGAGGSFVVHPYLGVLVYYLFAVLRPQFIWEWSLPPNFAWSYYVAIAAMISTLAWKVGIFSFEDDRDVRNTYCHLSLLLFATWMVVCYFTARNQEVAYPVFLEYIKIFVMFVVARYALTTVRHAWALYMTVTLALCYIAYELNELYFNHGKYLLVYQRGYGGLDNNGAALMLAMGVPLCLYAWDNLRHWIRWFFLFMILFILHAVLTSYSRGAMLSLLLSVPIYLIRCRRRLQLLLVFAGVAIVMPLLAGQEIRDRFFSIKQHEVDDSANSRKRSWAIAWQMASENPIFGMGIRNSPLYTFAYGADMEGRAIHSQYLQIAADCGFIGLGAYLLLLGTCTSCWWRLARATRRRDDPDSRRAYAIACGVEGALLVFGIGAAFLSLESFELPFIMILLGAQAWAIWQARPPEDPLYLPAPAS
jgi:probable O-glycosylation ligase (exosortase A-associated)